MDISLTHRLSYKQAKLTVLAAFILGTLLSLIQVGLDYASEDESIDREIHSLMEISNSTAARIAYNLDAELAQELALGLLHSPAVMRAEIIDSSSLILAAVDRPAASSRYRVFSDFLFGPHRQFQSPLYIDNSPKEPFGMLRLEVDTYAFGSHFLRRALLTMLTGFARSLLLSMILLVLFYSMLTKPLVGVIRALSDRDPRRDFAPVPCPPGHERDEVGTLVAVTNRQLTDIHQEIGQRRAAENQLTQYLAELENIVSARTAELQAANARLTRSNQELEQARKTALETARARGAFLAHMSHEIRTPLNGLLGMLELSLDGPLSREQRQQLSIAHDSGKVLVELLNDILDLSKFEAGQLELERLPFDLGALVENTASLLSQNADAQVELTCLIDPQLPELVLGDPTRVRQIVSNLLSNALKFTPRGRVDLQVSASPSDVCIVIRDTGIGIAKDAQQRIFQPFIQADAGISRQFGGTGLGLALSRSLCEAMQGQLSVSSQEGSGSRFSVTLPLPAHAPAAQWLPLQGQIIALCPAKGGLAELLQHWLPKWGLQYRRLDMDADVAGCSADLLICSAAQQLPHLRRQLACPLLLVSPYEAFIAEEQADALAPFEQLPRPLARATLHQALQRLLAARQGPRESDASPPVVQRHKARVLLVEDNQVNQLVAKGLLGKLGCEVAVAAHGGDAIAYLEQHPVDLVLMDCNMPVMDGYEATRRIREKCLYQDLPIIALTASALPEERQRCLAAGMNGYLAKPFHREELATLLDTWLPLTSAP